MKKQTMMIPGPWEFREFPDTARRMSDLNEGHWLKTDHPQSIILSLAQASILTLDDVYAHPQAFQWVGRQSWVFRKQFNLTDPQLAAAGKELVFEGLDTVTQIWLNNKLLGRTDNMFMHHRFDAGALLRPGENMLVIQFMPAREHADKLMRRYGRPDDISSEQKSCGYLRKAQYQFGSAMGPDLINCGIVRPVRLEWIPAADITDIHFRTIDCNESFADIRAAVTIRPMDDNSGMEFRCVLRIHGKGLILSHTLVFRGQQNRLSAVLRIERPVLWQPAGYGTPFCYSIEATLYCKEELLDKKETSFGIRTVRVLRPQDEHSTLPTLEINQQAIIPRGVYWIPTGLFPASDDARNTEHLLHQLARANVNTLCIWGKGFYEEDSFYDLCDRLGILVWQELMFTPVQVSDHLWLVNEFRREMEQVLCRLRNHACLVGWVIGRPGWPRTNGIEKRKKTDPVALLIKEITEMLAEGDPDRECLSDLDLLQSGESTHYQIHSHGFLDTPQSAPDTREKPICALPCLQTLRMACCDQDLYPGSASLEKQIYCSTASSALAARTEVLFAPPKTIEAHIYQTQVSQARWAKKQIESIRAGTAPQTHVMPWTAGQYWPCAGFSMVDFNRKPNAMYYYTKRGFAPVLICLSDQKADPQTGPSSLSPAAVIVNDRPDSLMGKMEFQLLGMNGQILDSGEFPAVVSPHSRSSNLVLPRAFTCPTFPEKNILRLAICDRDQILCENIYLFVPDKYALFKPLEIDLTIQPVSRQKILLGLQSRYFVKDLHLIPAHEAQLEDNFIDLLPGRNYEIAVTFAQPLERPDMPWIMQSSCTL